MKAHQNQNVICDDCETDKRKVAAAKYIFDIVIVFTTSLVFVCNRISYSNLLSIGKNAKALQLQLSVCSQTLIHLSVSVYV